jgi:putative membrane protein
MRGLLARLVLNTLALWLVSLLYPGVKFTPGAGLADYLVAGAIWGLANAMIRPVLLLLALPLNLLTLGLFTLVVNGVNLYLVAQVTALEVQSFPSALIGATLLSLVSLALNWLFRD